METPSAQSGEFPFRGRYKLSETLRGCALREGVRSALPRFRFHGFHGQKARSTPPQSAISFRHSRPPASFCRRSGAYAAAVCREPSIRITGGVLAAFPARAPLRRKPPAGVTAPESPLISNGIEAFLSKRQRHIEFCAAFARLRFLIGNVAEKYACIWRFSRRTRALHGMRPRSFRTGEHLALVLRPRIRPYKRLAKRLRGCRYPLQSARIRLQTAMPSFASALCAPSAMKQHESKAAARAFRQR